MKKITLLYSSSPGQNLKGENVRKDFYLPNYADVSYVIGRLKIYDVNDLREFMDIESFDCEFIQGVGPWLTSGPVKDGGKYIIGRSKKSEETSFLRNFRNPRFTLLEEK